MLHNKLFLKCEGSNYETSTIKSFMFRVLNNSENINFELGKYINIEYVDGTNKIANKCYSIVGIPEKDLLQIIVKKSTDYGVSARIHKDFTYGTIINAYGPSGKITCDSLLKYKNITMTSGGIGFSLPFALIRGLAKSYKNGIEVPNVNFILCCSYLNELIFLSELFSIEAENSWLKIHIFITKGKVPHDSRHFMHGRPSNNLLHKININSEAFILCGSGEFVNEYKNKYTSSHPLAEIICEYFSIESQPISNNMGIINIINMNKSINISKNTSLLDGILSSGINIKNQCRAGICGSCRIKIISGKCNYNNDIAISSQEKRNGYALACCTYALDKEIAIEI